MWYKYTMEFYFTLKKKLSYKICRKMDGTGRYYTELDNLGSEIVSASFAPHFSLILAPGCKRWVH